MSSSSTSHSLDIQLGSSEQSALNQYNHKQQQQQRYGSSDQGGKSRCKHSSGNMARECSHTIPGAGDTIQLSVARPQQVATSSDIQPNQTTLRYDSQLDALVNDDGDPVLHFRSDSDQPQPSQRVLTIAIICSMLVNIALLLGKVYAAVTTRSIAIAASAVDSALDLLATLVVWVSEKFSSAATTSDYPAGKSRLQTVGLIVCASFMGFGSLQVVLEAARELAEGISKHHHVPELNLAATLVLVLTVVSKFLLYLYCTYKAPQTNTITALAADHLNDGQQPPIKELSDAECMLFDSESRHADVPVPLQCTVAVMSNCVAIGAAVIAHLFHTVWWLDNVGGIVIAVYIAYRWLSIGREQAEMLVGKRASQQFIDAVRQVAQVYDSDLYPASIRAYAFGPAAIVELKLVLNPELSNHEVHDLTLQLQQLLECVEEVERAFVHTDFTEPPFENEHEPLLLAKVHPCLLETIKAKFPVEQANSRQ